MKCIAYAKKRTDELHNVSASATSVSETIRKVPLGEVQTHYENNKYEAGTFFRKLALTGTPNPNRPTSINCVHVNGGVRRLMALLAFFSMTSSNTMASFVSAHRSLFRHEFRLTYLSTIR